MCVGRLKIVGIGSGNSPWAALAVKDKAHNFFLTPMRHKYIEVCLNKKNPKTKQENLIHM